MIFKSVNNPLRDEDRKERNEKHKLPLLVCWLTKAIKKLRTVAAEREKEEREKSADANIAMDFWRGMGDVDLLEKFS